MKRDYIAILFLLLLMNLETKAQINQAVWFSDSLIQKTKLNPAHRFKGNFTISIPNVFFEISQLGPKYSDIVEVNSEGITTINISAATASAKENNYYGTFLDVGSFGFGLNAGNSSFTLEHSLRLNAFLSYPKSLVELYANGNAQFIGQTVSVGPDVQLNLFHQIALGYSYGNEVFRVGARMKFLSGLEDVSVERSQINLHTNEDIYQLEFDNDYLINTSSLLTIEDLSDITFDFDGIDYGDFFSANSGVAFDLGAEYYFNNGNSLSLSVLDIGKINWDENVTNYHSFGNIQFEGIDIVDVIRDSTDIFLTDSLYNILEFEESNVGYSSSLPLKLYAGYSQIINEQLRLSYLYFLQQYNGRTHHAFAVNGNLKLGEVLFLGANYMYRSDSPFNIGLQGTLKLGPFQIYASTVNFIGLFNPKSNTYTSANIGINLVF